MDQAPPTDFLMSTSSFLSGMATVVDLRGGFYEYNRSATPVEADATAIAADWAKVGEDMRNVIANQGEHKTGG